MNEEDLFRAYGRPSASRSRIAVPDPAFVAAVERERFKASNEVERAFWKHVRRLPGINSCWVWDGPRSRAGYGIIRVGGRNVPAHRLSWEIAHGEAITDGMLTRHTCDRPPCVRPDHLLTGTSADNYADMVTRKRACYQKGVRDRNLDRPRREREFRARRAEAVAGSIHYDEPDVQQFPTSYPQLSEHELLALIHSHPVRCDDGSALGDDGEGERLGRGYDERTRETA